MKRPSKFDGKGQSLTGDVLPFPSLARSAGPTTIQFPSPAASAGAREDAGVSSASASSTFVSIGAVTHAVVLRLRGGFPKISMPPRSREEEGPTSAADQSAGDLG